MIKTFGKMDDDTTRKYSKIIDEMFERRQIDSRGKEILAIAIIYERQPTFLAGTVSDPFESSEIQQLRILLNKILPSFQPHIIPGHLKIGPKTLVTGFQVENVTHDVAFLNPMLATMLANLLKNYTLLYELERGNCSALSISGNSVATGETRIALIVLNSISTATNTGIPKQQLDVNRAIGTTKQEITQARATKPIEKKVIVAALIILGLFLCSCIVAVSMYLLHYSK